MITVSINHLTQVRTSGTAAYSGDLRESISCLANVSSTATHISMQSIKDSNSFAGGSRACIRAMFVVTCHLSVGSKLALHGTILRGNQY